MSKEKLHVKLPTIAEIVVTLGVVVVMLVITIPAIVDAFRSRDHQNMGAGAHNLAVAMFSYSVDNNSYPSGPTSTAIFQKLYDGKYLQMPRDVYLPMAGKIICLDNPVKVLRAQNVSWDVWEHADGKGLDETDPPNVPLVISTGLGPYTFVDGSNPVKIDHPEQWAFGRDGILIAYRNQESKFIHFNPTSDTTINLTSPDFKVGTGSYKSVQP